MNKKIITNMISLFILVLMLFGNVYAQEAAETAQTQAVTIGKETDDGTSLDSMFPQVIYIQEGETVTFTNGTKIVPHTVTFLAGAAPLSPEDPKNMAPSAPNGVAWDGKTLLNSGILEPGKSYSVTFTSSGAFPYYCILHPLMKGTVVVVPKGQPIPSKVEMAAAEKAQTDDLISQAHALKAAKHEVTHKKNQDGTLTYQMEMGAGHQGFSINKMLPETLLISEGDTVEWLNDNHYEPHWVTFNKPADLSFFMEGGAFNPKFMVPAGGPKFDGTGFTNSGLIPPMKSYKLTFTKPGSYYYECYLHSGYKMAGTIVVTPKDAIKVTVNDKPLLYDHKLPHLHNNHVFVSIVPFVEALGGKVTYNQSLGAVVANIGGEHQLPAQIKNAPGVKVILNGKQLIYGFDPAPHLHDGRSFASAQEMVSLLGGSYSWDEASKTFAITVK